MYFSNINYSTIRTSTLTSTKLFVSLMSLPTKTLYEFLLSHTCYIFRLLIIPDVMIIFSDRHKL